MNERKMAELREKARFLSETLYSQNWKSAEDVKKLMEQIKTMDWYENFLTDEAGLFTVIAYSEGYKIITSYHIWKLIEERYNALIADFREKREDPFSDDIDEDERWCATGIFRIDIGKDQESKEIWIYHIGKSGGGTLLPKRD